VIVWLWDAGGGRGVTDDQARARQAAETLIRAGRADAACVEKALLVTGMSALMSGYLRTGDGWTAQPRRDGLIRWVRFPPHRSGRPHDRPRREAETGLR
jgi:hypothetical protein